MKDLDIKKIQPTKGYVLVEPAKAEEKTKSGIILSESDSEKPQYGVVLAVGEADCDCDCEDGCCSEGDDCCESEGCCGGGCCESDESEKKSCTCGGHGECQCGKDDEKDSKNEKNESCCQEGSSCCGEEESCCSDDESCCGEGCCEDSYYISACSCTAPVKVGDKVIYKKWGGNEFKIGDTEYQFLKFEDILAVIND